MLKAIAGTYIAYSLAYGVHTWSDDLNVAFQIDIFVNNICT